MKKFGSLALAALMVTALGVTSSAAAKTFEAASGTPTIDGIMDDLYTAAEEVKINVATSGDGKTSGTARVLWDSDNIYVFFDIVDPVLSTAARDNYYESDSVEFFIDLSGTPGDITTINAGQWTAQAPIPGAKGDWQGRGIHRDTNVDNASYKAVKTDNGYAIEMQIPFGADYTPKADAVITAAFHINSDETGADGRDGEYFANEGQGNAWSTSEAYDNLVLTSKKYEAPKVEASTNTADMGIVAALASLAASGVAVLSLKKRK
ncbi:MAG: hypothetical protein HFE63_03995 [Clostridiales bacterium]|nr:hypothetical protein [Clostridiales bacterium]